MESALTRSTQNGYSAFSSVCTIRKSTPGQGLGWRFVRRSWKETAAGSGWSQTARTRARRSISRCRREGGGALRVPGHAQGLELLECFPEQIACAFEIAGGAAREQHGGVPVTADWLGHAVRSGVGQLQGYAVVLVGADPIAGAGG